MRIREIVVLALLMGSAPVAAGAGDGAMAYRAAARALAYGNLDAAIWYAGWAIRMNPGLGRAYGVRAIALQRQGFYDRAIADTTKAIIFDPGDAVAYNNRGVEYAGIGRHDLAIADYNRAIALRPDFAEAYAGRGGEYGRMGAYDNSIADLQRAVALRPNYAEAHQNLGISLDRAGRPDQAQAEYRLALALRPDLQQAQAALARPVSPVVFSNPVASAPQPAPVVPRPPMITVAPPPSPPPSTDQPPLLAGVTGPLVPVSVSPLPRKPDAMASVTVPPPQAAVAPPPRFPDRPLAVNFAPGPDRPDDVAVIIGNADYAKFDKDIPDVRPAYADAEGIKLYVKQALGIHEDNIIFVKDATGAQMVTLFGSDRDFRGKLFNYVHPGVSRVFVYYAGHGAPPAERDGSPYLVPADADASNIELSGYPLATLYDNLGKLPAERVTLVLEACFSGLSPDGPIIRKASPIRLVATAPAVPRDVTVISAGTGDQMASWERDDSDGLFTKYFLLGMSGEAAKRPYGNGDGNVTLDSLSRYLKGTMTYYARRYYGREQVAQFIKGAGA